jgi:hypothetical protein
MADDERQQVKELDEVFSEFAPILNKVSARAGSAGRIWEYLGDSPSILRALRVLV